MKKSPSSSPCSAQWINPAGRTKSVVRRSDEVPKRSERRPLPFRTPTYKGKENLIAKFGKEGLKPISTIFIFRLLLQYKKDYRREQEKLDSVRLGFNPALVNLKQYYF